MSRYLWVLVVAAALAGLGAGMAVNRWLAESPGTPGGGRERIVTDVRGQQRPAFELPTPDGAQRSIAEFDGQVVLLNFWATWCAPCVDEVPALAEAQQALGERGLQVVGLALDEAAPVREFAAEYGINYPVLIGGRDAFAIAAEYGNDRGVLPYSVVIDRDGTIRKTHLGVLDASGIRALVEPLL